MSLRRDVLNVVELERALLPPQLRGAYMVHGGAETGPSETLHCVSYCGVSISIKHARNDGELERVKAVTLEVSTSA